MIDPRLYVMIETELWPNLLEELHKKDIPVALVNGRISDSSFKNYRKIGFVTKRIFDCIDIWSIVNGFLARWRDTGMFKQWDTVGSSIEGVKQFIATRICDDVVVDVVLGDTWDSVPGDFYPVPEFAICSVHVFRRVDEPVAAVYGAVWTNIAIHVLCANPVVI